MQCKNMLTRFVLHPIPSDKLLDDILNMILDPAPTPSLTSTNM